MHPLTVSGVLIFFAAVALVTAALIKLRKQHIIARRLSRGRVVAVKNQRFSVHSLESMLWKLDPEVPVLLDRLGWRRPEKRLLFAVLQITVPLVALSLSASLSLANDASWLLPLFITGLAFLLPKRWLVRAARQRRLRIAAEVSALLPLLRMLFEVGMTVEQALRVLMTEGSRILPEMSSELRIIMNRVSAGLDLGDELMALEKQLDVDEWTDCASILSQLLRQGGGALASLTALKELFDDRRMTTLQERVSKLSAKMSAVMVAFLFPALLIVLAGPGFASVFAALGSMAP